MLCLKALDLLSFHLPLNSLLLLAGMAKVALEHYELLRLMHCRLLGMQ